MKGKFPALILACILACLPLYEAGYFRPLDTSLQRIFESVLVPSTDISAPLPRELALRRLVDRTIDLLTLEGRPVDRDRLLSIAHIAERAGLQYQLPPSLILSVIHTESHFQPHAVSPDGAMGLMQLQFATAQEFADAAGIALPSETRLFDPEVNILLGTGYLRQLIDRFGDLRTALAAYHVGPTEIGRRLGVREPFSDRYGREIREREYSFVTSAFPLTTTASARG
jgi:soluble lytic murein transglycosylase-like protein